MCQPGARLNVRARLMVPLVGVLVWLMRAAVSRGVVARLLVAPKARQGSRQSSRASARMVGMYRLDRAGMVRAAG